MHIAQCSPDITEKRSGASVLDGTDDGLLSHVIAKGDQVQPSDVLGTTLKRRSLISVTSLS